MSLLVVRNQDMSVARRMTGGEIVMRASSRVFPAALLVGGGAVLALGAAWWLPVVGVVSYGLGKFSQNLATKTLKRELEALYKNNRYDGPFVLRFEMTDIEKSLTEMPRSTLQSVTRGPFLAAVRGVNAGTPSPEALLDLLKWNASQKLLLIELRINLMSNNYLVANSLLAMPRPRALRLLRCAIEWHALSIQPNLPKDLRAELHFLANSLQTQFTVPQPSVAADYDRLARLRLMAEALPA